jgi:hypothetical protein
LPDPIHAIGHRTKLASPSVDVALAELHFDARPCPIAPLHDGIDLRTGAVPKVEHGSTDRLGIHPEVSDHQRLEEVAECDRVPELAFRSGVDRCRGERWVDEVVLGRRAQLGARSEGWGPGWQVLDDEEPSQRRDILGA